MTGDTSGAGTAYLQRLGSILLIFLVFCVVLCFVFDLLYFFLFAWFFFASSYFVCKCLVSLCANCCQFLRIVHFSFPLR
jgi:hypothetical protein